MTKPTTTFFELPTGHYPMLSMPRELTEVLTEAETGRGRRIGA